jgi:hypothetical protein
VVVSNRAVTRHSSPVTAERGHGHGHGSSGDLTRLPTAPIAAAGLIAGFGVAVASGSRPLGGLVLAGCGLVCVMIWLRRDGVRTALRLTLAGLFAFAVSHVLGLLIGAWPAVLVVAAATAALYWRVSDSRRWRGVCGVERAEP